MTFPALDVHDGSDTAVIVLKIRAVQAMLHILFYITHILLALSENMLSGCFYDLTLYNI